MNVLVINVPHVVFALAAIVGGAGIGMVLHFILIMMLEEHNHYLFKMIEYLARPFPNGWETTINIVVIAGALVFGFVMLLICAGLYDNGHKMYMAFIVCGFGVYWLVVPMWQTWFPFVFRRAFPGRRPG